MANEIPQIQDTQPIITPQHVVSQAEGYEAFAKTLGSIAGTSAKVAEKIVEDQSNSMYLTSVADIDKLKLNTQKLILTDPANAEKYSQAMNYTLDTLKDNTYVNKSDRQKLTQYANHSSNSVELDAIQATVKQAQIGAAYEHRTNFSNQLNALGEAALSDPKKFEELKEDLVNHIKQLVMTGSLTPLQGASDIKSMSDRIEMVHDMHDIYKNAGIHSAQNYHAAMSNPFEPNKTNNLDYPVDENTNWLVKYHASDNSFQGARDSIQYHFVPDWKSLQNMTPHQRNQIKMEVNGVRAADGIINSNSSLPKIVSRINELEGRTDYQSLAEKKNLKQYIDDWKNGNSQRLMARTTIGGRIVRDYTDTQAFLNNKLNKLDPSKPENLEEIANVKNEIAKNKNEYVNNGRAYQIAHHWPYAHLIPKEDVAIVKNGFNFSGNPGENAANSFETFNQYSKENQMYFADEMKDPLHKVVLQTIALSDKENNGMIKGNTTQEKIDFIAANQNRNYKEIDLRTNASITDDYLKNQINTKITDAIKIIQGQNDAIDATALNEKLIRSGVNYAKFLSEKKGQYSMKEESIFNSINNVTAVTEFINRAYKPLSGANYIINQKQNDIEKIQMDAVAQYAINEGNDYLKKHVSDAQYIAMQNQSPLTVTITPTNNVVAKDALGNIAYSSPLTSDLIAHADAMVKKEKEKEEKLGREIFESVRRRKIL